MDLIGLGRIRLDIDRYCPLRFGEVTMRSPQLEPTMTRTLTCLHMRLIDRIRCEDETERPLYRCLECGAVIQDPNAVAKTSA